MNTALFVALNPLARMQSAVAALAHEMLTAPPQRTPRRTTGPAAEMLRTLPARAAVTVEQPLGLDVVCIKGTLWITHDDDILDHVIESGGTYTAKRSGRMLIQAMTDARFIVEPNDC